MAGIRVTEHSSGYVIQMIDKGIMLEIAFSYKSGATIRELVESTGYSQRRIRTAIAKSGVPFRRKGRRTRTELRSRPGLLLVQERHF